ncbi:MAG: hypothetical protein QF475_01075, partial [Candidatus Undinarchaeales archaeon]|nr:hypothetical protein [Candidatus Undinarchaeales archaeon]
MPKKKEKIDMLKDQDKIKELVRKYKAEQAEKKPTYTQSVEEFSVESREFKDFYAGQMESEKAHSMYEKLAKIGGKIIKMKVKEKDADKMGKQLYSIGYHITPADVMGLAILTLIIFVLIGGAFILKNYVISLVVIMI